MPWHNDDLFEIQFFKFRVIIILSMFQYCYIVYCSVVISNVTKFETIAKSQSVSCTADTSQPCSYSWIRDEASSKTTVVEDRVLHLKDAGHYVCKAECTVRSTTCIVYPMAIHFKKDNNGNKHTIMTVIYFGPSPANQIIISE